MLHFPHHSAHPSFFLSVSLTQIDFALHPPLPALSPHQLLYYSQSQFSGLVSGSFIHMEEDRRKGSPTVTEFLSVKC